MLRLAAYCIVGLFSLISPVMAADTTPAQTTTTQAQQNSPRQLVQWLYDSLLVVMKHGDKLGFTGRYNALKPVIERAYDMPTMSRFSAGGAWLKGSAAEQQQLIAAFGDYSIATYASRFQKFGGEIFTVLGEEPAAGGGTIVKTQLQPNGDSAVTLNYLLRQDAAGAWRINDVFLDATISEMAMRRSEYSATAREGGLNALTAAISQKIQAMRDGAK